MSIETKTLLEMRDRGLSRLIDYDLKVLTLLIGMATVWGVVAVLEADIVNPDTRELVELVLATSGLFMSLSWSSRRKFLFQIDDSLVQALHSVAPMLVPAPSIERELRNWKERRLAALAGVVTASSLRNGHIVAVVIFALISAFALVSAWNQWFE